MKHIHSVYEWHKEQLWLQLVIITIGAVIVNFFEVIALIRLLIYMLVFTKVIMSLKLMNPNPGSINDQENFSWKYYQSLPITKKELYNLFLTNSIFNYLPALYCIIVFNKDFSQILEISRQEYASWVPPLVVVLFIFSGFTFHQLVVYPRAQFSRLNKRILLLQNLRNVLYGLVGFPLTLMFGAMFAHFLKYDFPEIWKFLVAVTPYFWNKPIAFVYLLLFAAFNYHDNFKVWLDEKRRTPRLNWKTSRDVPLMAVVLSSLYLPFAFVDLSQDGGPEIHEAIISNNMRKVSRLVKDSKNLNLRNKNGFTPLMTAAYRGRKELFELLVKSGADLNQNLPVRKDYYFSGSDLYTLCLKGGNLFIVQKLFSQEKLKYVHPESGFTSLHLAVSYCHEGVVEFLIENGLDVDAADKKGRTSLHIAAEKNCFPAVASLFEAGADPLIKDKKNKFAYDYGTKGSRSPASYIKRKTLKRLPQK